MTTRWKRRENKREKTTQSQARVPCSQWRKDRGNSLHQRCISNSAHTPRPAPRDCARLVVDRGNGPDSGFRMGHLVYKHYAARQTTRLGLEFVAVKRRMRTLTADQQPRAAGAKLAPPGHFPLRIGRGANMSRLGPEDSSDHGQSFGHDHFRARTRRPLA